MSVSRKELCQRWRHCVPRGPSGVFRIRLFCVCVSLWPVDCVTRSPGQIAPFPSPLLLLTSAVSKQRLCSLLISSPENIQQISSLWKIKILEGFKGPSDLSYLPPKMAFQVWKFICENSTQVTCLSCQHC